MLIEVPALRGVHEEADARILPPPGLVAAENVALDRGGRFVRRRGYALLADDTQAGGTMAAPVAAWARGDELVAVETLPTNGAYGWDPESETWIARGTLPGLGAVREYATGGGDYGSAALRVGTIDIVVQQGTDLVDIVASAYDTTTGGLLDRVEFAGGGAARLTVAGTTIILVYETGGNTVARTTTVTAIRAGTMFSAAPTTLVAGVGLWDADASSDGLYLYSGNTIYRYDTALALVSSIAAGMTPLSPEYVAIHTDAANDRVWVVVVDGLFANILEYRAFAHDLSGALVAATTVVAIVSASAYPAIYGVSATEALVVAGVSGAFGWWRVSTGGVVKKQGVCAQAIRPASRVFAAAAAESDPLIWAMCTGAYPGATTPGYSSALLLTLPSLATSLTPALADNQTRPLCVAGAGVYQASGFGNPATGAGDVWCYRDTNATVRVVSHAAAELHAAEAFGVTYLAGRSMLMESHADIVCEHSFACWARIIDVSETAVIGAFPNGSVIGFVAVYEWVDAAGRVHRSPPSPPYVHTCAAAGGPWRVDVDVAVLDATLRDRPNLVPRGRPAEIVLYSTAVGGSIYRRLASVRNEPCTGSVTFQVLAAAEDDAELLYTEGGVFAAAPSPSAAHVAALGDRVIWSDGPYVRATTIATPTEAPHYAEELAVTFPGRVVAVGAMDGAIIAATPDGVYVVQGDGPDDTGGGMGWSLPRQLPAAGGAKQAAGAVACSLGWCYVAHRGLYIVPRGLGVPVWIGEPLRDSWDAGTILGASACRDDGVVRWAQSAETTTPVFVLDETTREWVTEELTNDVAVGCAYASGAFAVVGGDGVWLRGSSYVDATTVPTVLLQTGKLRASLLSRARWHEVHVFGRCVGACTVTIAVAMDDGEAFSDSASYDLTAATGTEFDLVYAIPRAEARSVQVRVTETHTGATQGCEYAGIVIEYSPQGPTNGVSRG